MSQSFLEFPDSPVTFKLIQGSGPVHIHGHHILGEYEIEDEELAEEEEEEITENNDIESGDDDESDVPKKKIKLSAKPAKNSKGGKKK